MLRSVVQGCGAYLPERIVSNEELAKKVDTSDEWIQQRTGIKQRHIAADGELTSHLAVKAADRALAHAGLSASDLDLIVVATATPDETFPATATVVQKALGMTRGAAFVFEIHGDDGDLTLAATTRDSMQRQELTVRGAQGSAKELAELPVPARYRWVPDGTPTDSRYNVAQLYARLAESIHGDKPATPGFDAAIARHRLLDAIVRASESGQKQIL